MAKPQLRSWRDWARIYLAGMGFGCADIVPGISSGTVAFILGIYHTLLDSIRSLNVQALSSLTRLHLRDFFNQVAWEFFLALGLGIITTFILLSRLINDLLNDPIYRVFLFAFFVGLVIGAAYFCSKQVSQWHLRHRLFLLGAMILAFSLTLGRHALPPASESLYQVSWINWWLFACGILGVCAMLLPGISGSYMLTILGAYPVAIAALADLLSGARHLQLDTDAFLTLTSIFLGMVTGAVLFSRLLSWLLRTYHDLTVAALTGFMIGALPAVWPFWSYEYRIPPLRMDKAPQLHPVEPIWPQISSPTFWIALVCAGLGIGLILALERLSRIHNSMQK